MAQCMSSRMSIDDVSLTAHATARAVGLPWRSCGTQYNGQYVSAANCYALFYRSA